MTPLPGPVDTSWHQDHRSVTGSGPRHRPARQHRTGARAGTGATAGSSWAPWAVRLLVGTVIADSIVMGFTAIRRRDITAHRAWMTRTALAGSR